MLEKRTILATLLLALFSSFVLAQDVTEDDVPPIYLTARIFEAKAKKDTPISDQVFKMRTPVQATDEKWLANLKKAYPDFELSLLQTTVFRSFRTARPYIISLGNSKQSHIEIHILTAFSEGDGKTPGTTVFADVNLYRGEKTKTSVPMSLATQTYESELGTTHFFTTQELGLNGELYAKSFRNNLLAPQFEQEVHYVVIALSAEKEVIPNLNFEAKKIEDLQTNALVKPEPKWPDELIKNKFYGKVQVRVDLNFAGKVTAATIWRSSLPEGNAAALDAAQRWEFPPAALTDMKAPYQTILSFELAPALNRSQESPVETAPTKAKTPTAAKPATPKKTVVRKK